MTPLRTMRVFAFVALAVLVLGQVRADFCLNGPGSHNLDTDGDGFVDCADNCPLQPNDQGDTDGDGVGDTCDCGITVTPGDHESLRTAVANAPDGCAIAVPAGHYVAPYGSDSLVFDHDVSLLGAGAGQTVIEGEGSRAVVGTGSYISPASRAFIGGVVVTGGGVGVGIGPSTEPLNFFTLSDVVISGNAAGGIAVDGGLYLLGGDIDASAGLVYLNNSVVAANSVGGIWVGDGISAGGGRFTAWNSRIEQNEGRGVQVSGTFEFVGGGEASFRRCTIDSNRGGGIAISPGDATVSFADGTISRNTSTDPGGGIFVGGHYGFGAPVVSLSRTTVSGNVSQSDGGGLFNGGASSEAYGDRGPGLLNLSNVTISGNSAAGAGGGLFNDGADDSAHDGGKITCQNCTITDNQASIGGGAAFATTHPGQADLGNSVIAGNTATIAGDCSGELGSQGHNLIQDPSGCSIVGDTTGNILGTDPGLGPLGNNGGPSLTHRPGPPLLDAANPLPPWDQGLPRCPVVDQRGIARPLGSACDIGAVEGCPPGEPDADGDGWCDGSDDCPAVANADQSDLDGDGTGDACDPDDDGDGQADPDDNCPAVVNPEQSDLDADGRGDPCDDCPSIGNAPQGDFDGDGFGDACDNCPHVFSVTQTDTDLDGVGDACDPCPMSPGVDSDNDGVCGTADNCPDVANPAQTDSDDDRRGDVCDNCPASYNDTQTDSDLDGMGDACDNCPSVFNDTQIDSDMDGTGDACDPCPRDAADDADADGRCGDVDNCPTIANPSQLDTDGDGIGEPCDNCPTTFNDTQSDLDRDGAGDPCDPCPTSPGIDSDNDGFCGTGDNCPYVFNPSQADLDADGVGDACDNCPDVTNPTQQDLDRGQWAVSAVASSEWSPTDWSAGQATGAPDSAGVCGDLPTHWAPLTGGVSSEWLELTYAVPVRARSVVVHESFESGFVRGVELIDGNGIAHALPSVTDTTACGETLVRSFDVTPYLVSRVRVTTEVDGWEQIDAVELMSGFPDGAGDACDVCPDLYDPDQNDADGDGRGDPCDCAPTDPAVRTPDEVELTVSKAAPDVVRIDWNWPLGADSFQVTRGRTEFLASADYGSCFAAGLVVQSIEDVDIPPEGSCVTYLVQPRSAVCGAGSLGRLSSGAERTNSSPYACP